jgi:hypothetical protein
MQSVDAVNPEFGTTLLVSVRKGVHNLISTDVTAVTSTFIGQNRLQTSIFFLETDRFGPSASW